MKRVFLLPLLVSLAGLSACGSSEPAGPLADVEMSAERSEALATPGRLEFSGLRLVPLSDPADPVEPWIEGRIRAGYFQPTGDVVGRLGAPEELRGLIEGRLELLSRRLYLEGDGPISGPWVRGLKDTETGDFFPTSRVQGRDAPAAPR